MSGMISSWGRYLLMIVLLTTQACSDATGPSSPIELRVPQETLRQPASGTLYLQWIAHNRSSGPVNVGICSTSLERQVSPDNWATVRVSDVICIGVDVAAGKDLPYTVSFTGLEPGRYRIAVPWAAAGATSSSLAHSNAFDVT